MQIEKDVDFVPVRSTSSRYTALRAGSIDAASLSPPSSLLAQAAGYPSLFRFADYLEDIQASIVAGDERLARQSDLVRRFMRAAVKASAFISPSVRPASVRSWNSPATRTAT